MCKYCLTKGSFNNFPYILHSLHICVQNLTLMVYPYVKKIEINKSLATVPLGKINLSFTTLWCTTWGFIQLH